MEKSTTPTTKHSVSCDTYDTTMDVTIHKTTGSQKVKITIGNESGNELSLSLYKEDVDVLGVFLKTISHYLDKR